MIWGVILPFKTYSYHILTIFTIYNHILPYITIKLPYIIPYITILLPENYHINSHILPQKYHIYSHIYYHIYYHVFPYITFFFWRNQLNPFSHPFTSYDFVPDLLHREASEPAPQSSFQIDLIGVFQIARETVCIWYVYIYTWHI